MASFKVIIRGKGRNETWRTLEAACDRAAKISAKSTYHGGAVNGVAVEHWPIVYVYDGNARIATYERGERINA